MNKNELVRNGINALAGIGAVIGTWKFTKKRADEMIESIPYKDGAIRGSLKSFGIGATQGLIVCTVAATAVETVNNLVQSIQNK